MKGLESKVYENNYACGQALVDSLWNSQYLISTQEIFIKYVNK